MKTVVNKAIRDEKGAALALALVLLVVGGLILTPLLGLMSTGLLAGQVYEKTAHEYYSADSGVEDAIWKITHDDTLSYPYQYQLTAGGKTVGVAIDRYDWDPTCGENLTYQIISIAATNASGRTAATDTRIDAEVVVSYMDFSSLLDYAIVSNYTVDIQSGNNVSGDVWLPQAGDLAINKNNSSISGTIYDSSNLTIRWPRFDQLSSYYWEDVKGLEFHPEYVIDIPNGTTQANPLIIGPLWAPGDLTIQGSGWIRLDGTIYVKETLDTNPTPAINIDLNGHTMFAEIGTNGVGIKLNPGVTLYRSGCFIAKGEINFQPALSGEPGQYVLVLSVEGTTKFNPSTEFHGTVAGSYDVTLQPGNHIEWTDWKDKDLDFPTGPSEGELPPVTAVSILFWDIS